MVNVDTPNIHKIALSSEEKNELDANQKLQEYIKLAKDMGYTITRSGCSLRYDYNDPEYMRGGKAPVKGHSVVVEGMKN